RLALCLCVDFENSVRFVQPASLDEWALDADTAFTVARANLGRRSEGGLVEESPGLFCSPWQDTYDAARVILPWALERARVAGERVVALPNRDTLLVAGADDADALRRLIAATEAGYANTRRLTLRLHVVRDGALEPLRLPTTHPLRSEVERLDAQDWAAE